MRTALEQAASAGGNTLLATGTSAGVMGYLSANYDVVMISLTAFGVFGGLVLKGVSIFLDYKIKKKRLAMDIRNENKTNNQ